MQKHSTITKVNGKDANEEVLNAIKDEEKIRITLEPPKKPPALPQYIVIEFKGYSESGGPPFFAGIEKADYVPIPLERMFREHGSEKSKNQVRLSFAVEGGDAATTFKCQGSTHECNEVRIKAVAEKIGQIVVGYSRVKTPRDMYIPEGTMPNDMDIRLQRLNPDCIDSECFERELKIRSAVTVRQHMANNQEMYGNQWNEEQNAIADIINDSWRKGVTDVEQIIHRVSTSMDASDTDVKKYVRK